MERSDVAANREATMITIPPSLVERPETPYVAVARHVSMSQLDETIPQAIDEVAAWLTTQGD